MAQLADSSKHSQIDWEANRASPNARYLESISKAGVDVFYIITGERRTSSSVSFQPLILRRAVEVADEELQAKPVRLTSAQKAEFITLLYEHFLSPEHDKKTIIDRFIRGAMPQSVDNSLQRGALKASAAISAKAQKFTQLNRRIR